jgi:hypothetical protein
MGDRHIGDIMGLLYNWISLGDFIVIETTRIKGD